jgi:phytoene dehydrogenase-like protein
VTNYDVIIIGAGHNGLVAAAYLAKAGRKVIVLEGRSVVGGAAVTEELFPGFHFSTIASGCGYLSPKVVRELKLSAHGLEIQSSDPVVFSPQPDGTQLTIWRDTARTVEEIERFSKADAEAYPAFVEMMRCLSGAVSGLLHITPPDVPEIGWSDLPSLRTLAGPLWKLGRGNINQLLRVLPMPVADLLNEHFESDELKGAIAASGVRDITWGPREAGTAYTLLYSWALSNVGLFRSAGHVAGGMGAITQVLARAAKAHGAEIQTNAAVSSVVVKAGRAIGVDFSAGERLNANTVVSNADPRTTYLDLLDPKILDLSVVRAVRNIKFRGSGARVHLALATLPEFTALSGQSEADRLTGAIQIAPTMTYLQRAYDCVKYGEYSSHPYLDIEIPTLMDPSLAPSGQHTMSITAKYAPYSLRSESWESMRAGFTDTVVSTLSEYAPKIRDCILHEKTLLPCDIESVYGLPEGSGSHGEMTLDQFLHMRPVPGHAQYETPIGGLFMCGAGTHPGGGVTGIPGHNAAREVLEKGRS